MSTQSSIPVPGTEGLTLGKEVNLHENVDNKQVLPEEQKLNKAELIKEARNVLLGVYKTSDELTTLYKKLEAADQFGYASELLLHKMELDKQENRPIGLSDYQTLAKYIYKDNSLPASFKFDEALKELNVHDDLVRTSNCETLGLAGAIYKRKWQFDHQYKNLALSLYHYEKGFNVWMQFIKNNGNIEDTASENDQGYNGINYAYINELMAIDEINEFGNTPGIEKAVPKLAIAIETRKYILQQFVDQPDGNDPKLKTDNLPDWVIATVAEAYFGLSRFDVAERFIKMYTERKNKNAWELRSFCQQIFSLAYLQQFRKGLVKNASSKNTGFPDLLRVMSAERGDMNACLQALDIRHTSGNSEINMDGKTGLALSGGGFRAALFHIGVLAALAEKDELRNIEVISCVSGGSIIGAYYYLKLKILLEEKADDEITKNDYIQLVAEIEKEFLDGVKKNLRMGIFTNLFKNLKMFSKDYSRTNRLGELYEEHLFRPIWEKEIKKTIGSKYADLLRDNGGNIYMQDLYIVPHPGFVMATDNWKRKNKVPQLILNATSVNTGHNWRFTASWMGEPPSNVLANVDVKPRLRRMYYKDAPDGYKNFRLGYAVGASSCVPVMFEPLPLNDLYPGIQLQLIDGGLHDNQGIAALIDEECRNMIVSDASGQLPTTYVANEGLFSLFMRADNILQERVRELQFSDLLERNYTTQISKLSRVHLKNGLQVHQLNWKYCPDPQRKISPFDGADDDNELMPYVVLRETQRLISQVRTDLDAFHDVEAYSLMYSGYAQINYEFARQENGREEEAHSAGPRHEWNFLAVQEYLTVPGNADKIKTLLSVSSKVFLKWVSLIPKALRNAMLIILGALACFLFYSYWSAIPDNVNYPVWPLLYAAGLFIVGLFSKAIIPFLNPKGTIRKWLFKIGLAVFGWMVSNLYLWIGNPFYLRMGKLKPKTKA